MSAFSPTDTSSLLQRGIAAARSGRSDQARLLLEQVLDADVNNEMAWLWLSGLVATYAQKQSCLKEVLRINPENIYARASLARLQDISTATASDLGTCVDPADRDIPPEQLLNLQRGNHKQNSRRR